MLNPYELSSIHHQCFIKPRPWTTEEFSQLLKKTLLIQKSRSFLIGRIVKSEAEILTLAVSPSERRKGLASFLMESFIKKAKLARVDRIILEVAEDNIPALDLYTKFSFTRVGERKSYYSPKTQVSVSNALVLEHNISYEL